MKSWLCVLFCAAAVSAFNFPLLPAQHPYQAPIIESLVAPAPADGKTYTPTVFMHGMGDAGKNAGMQSLCKSVSNMYPGAHSVCLDVADGTSSITTKMADQVAEFTAAVRADPLLANGFNAVGLSQGNLVVRAYIEQVNNPPVKRFISICGPHQGVGTCPDNILFKLVCPLWRIAPYSAPIAFSDYWKDVNSKDTYLSKSRWLADINNERDAKNETYKQNMLTLDKYVLVEALNDTMIIPHETAEHGFYPWGSTSSVQKLRETEAYAGDWIGLKTLDESQRLSLYTYVGDHLRFSAQFWTDTILPLLGN